MTSCVRYMLRAITICLFGVCHMLDMFQCQSLPLHPVSTHTVLYMMHHLSDVEILKLFSIYY